jgi:glycosyltransferase involved in cell wall biosynthesis
MGKALVATGLAVEGINAKEGVHYLRAETADEFAHQIRSLVEQPDLRTRLEGAARTLVETRYGWEQIGARLLSSYELAVAARAASRSE